MWIVDFLAPKHCVFCGVLSASHEHSICVACRADLPWCTVANSPPPQPFVCQLAMLDYKFPIDVAIKAMKFRRKLYYAPAFAEIICLARERLPPDIDAVLPVPLHWRRKAFRGFNQAAEIARPLAGSLNVPIVRGVRRDKATLFQSGLGAVERASNLQHAFSIRAALDYAHILIVDDVVTTGATLQQLGTVLRAGGVASVSALTLAQAR